MRFKNVYPLYLCARASSAKILLTRVVTLTIENVREHTEMENPAVAYVKKH